MNRLDALHRTLAIATLACLAGALPALGDDDVDPFYDGVGYYYEASDEQLLAVRGRVGTEEVPVVFHIAAESGVSPIEVVELRSAGSSWMEVGLHFGVGPEAYYVPLEHQPGPPYGKAWGYYSRPRGDWGTIRLSDEEIVDLVNLRFVTDYYGVDVAHVVDRRAKGDDHVGIARQQWKYDFRHGHRPGRHVTDRKRHGSSRDGHHGDGHRGDDRHRKGHARDGRDGHGHSRDGRSGRRGHDRRGHRDHDGASDGALPLG